MKLRIRAAAAGLAVLGLGMPGLGAGNNSHLMLADASQGPPGFRGICQNYGWACEGGQASELDDAAMMRLAIAVNSEVNRRIKPETDAEQYGVEERWTLPDTGKGDCEDYALLKKKILIEKGVPAGRLLFAVVRSTPREKHAMLVLRLDDGDFVLDNLTPEVIAWKRSSYKFLELQAPGDPQGWEAVKG